ncbi:hypothetical protein BAC2_02710 [uncultured bacterium]|nr:hypothetical protein BAC2_02710 [uncultured bacterium]
MNESNPTAEQSSHKRHLTNGECRDYIRSNVRDHDERRVDGDSQEWCIDAKQTECAGSTVRVDWDKAEFFRRARS